MALAITISEYGTMERADLHGYTDYRDEVGGMIEYVHLTDEVGAYVNEEGRYNGQTNNIRGTAVMAALMGIERGLAWVQFNGPVQGPVVLIGPTDEDGNTLDLPDWVFTRYGL